MTLCYLFHAPTALARPWGFCFKRREGATFLHSEASMSKIKHLVIGGAMTLLTLAALAFVSRSVFPPAVQNLFKFGA